MAGKSKVDVLTFFENGKIDPIKFRWNGKVYPVKRIYKQWKVKSGPRQLHHFLVESNGASNYELQFDTGKSTWQLTPIV